MEWAQVLVIILSVFLALFLLLAIILVALLIKVTRQIKNMTGSAQRVVQNFENTTDNVRMFTSPAMVTKIVKNFINNNKK